MFLTPKRPKPLILEALWSVNTFFYSNSEIFLNVKALKRTPDDEVLLTELVLDDKKITIYDITSVIVVVTLWPFYIQIDYSKIGRAKTRWSFREIQMLHGPWRKEVLYWNCDSERRRSHDTISIAELADVRWASRCWEMWLGCISAWETQKSQKNSRPCRRRRIYRISFFNTLNVSSAVFI